MIFNAMKILSEIDPRLFDDCTHDYEIAQAMIEDRARQQKEKWKKLEAMAEANRRQAEAARSQVAAPPPAVTETITSGN